MIDNNSLKPIYVQIAEFIEDEIIKGNMLEDERVYSQYQLAEMFSINPATASKGLNILADKNIIYKKRGLGMFVANGAKENISSSRINDSLKHMIIDIVKEARKLQVSEEELIRLIRQVNVEESGGIRV